MAADNRSPILVGDEAIRALEIVRTIAATNREIRDSHEGGLYLGLAGFAVLHGYLARLDGTDGDLAVEHLVAATERLEEPIQVGMAWGIAGVAWATHHLHTIGFSDLAVDESLDTFLEAHVATTPWEHPYDLMDGLAGIALGVTDRIDAPGPAQICAHVLARLEELAEPRTIGKTFTYLAPDSRGVGHTPQSFLGPAHGVTGVIALLGTFVERGFEVERSRRLANDLVAWILDRRLPAGPIVFPSIVREGEPVRGGAGWCHGDPGIATVLHLAARRLGLPDAEQIAIAALRSAANDPRVAVVETAGFCHGSAGFTHIFARAAERTGDPDLRDVALASCRRTMERWEREIENETPLLQGPIGIALVLLTAATSIDPGWEAAFGLR